MNSCRCRTAHILAHIGERRAFAGGGHSGSKKQVSELLADLPMPTSTVHKSVWPILACDWCGANRPQQKHMYNATHVCTSDHVTSDHNHNNCKCVAIPSWVQVIQRVRSELNMGTSTWRYSHTSGMQGIVGRAWVRHMQSTQVHYATHSEQCMDLGLELQHRNWVDRLKQTCISLVAHTPHCSAHHASVHRDSWKCSQMSLLLLRCTSLQPVSNVLPLAKLHSGLSWSVKFQSQNQTLHYSLHVVVVDVRCM